MSIDFLKVWGSIIVLAVIMILYIVSCFFNDGSDYDDYDAFDFDDGGSDD